MRLPPSRATVVIGAVTVIAWIAISAMGFDNQAALGGGFIPERMNAHGQAEVVRQFDAGGVFFAPAWLTPLTCTLIHAGILHLAFNMLMLGFCGRFVEVALGPVGVVLLYVGGAYAGAATQYLTDPNGLVPTVGASGAISAWLGAYALLFGEPKGKLAAHPLGGIIQMVWLAGAWIGLQLLIGFAAAQTGMGIAVAAHIGGFMAGLVLTRPILLWSYRKA